MVIAGDIPMIKLRDKFLLESRVWLETVAKCCIRIYNTKNIAAYVPLFDFT